jgi:uncharacterized protein with GYD domain
MPAAKSKALSRPVAAPAAQRSRRWPKSSAVVWRRSTFAFGEDDVYTTVELPDNKTATAVALAINSTGQTSVRTVVLMTPEEVDGAATQTVNYAPPGA